MALLLCTWCICAPCHRLYPNNLSVHTSGQIRLIMETILKMQQKRLHTLGNINQAIQIHPDENLTKNHMHFICSKIHTRNWGANIFTQYRRH